MSSLTLEEVKSSYDYMRFSVADIHGITRSKTIPKRSFDKCFDDGVPLYAGAMGFTLRGDVLSEKLPELGEINQGNLWMLPQLNTIHPLPLATTSSYNVGQVLCETIYKSSGVLKNKIPCTRSIAQQQLECLRDLGFTLMSGFEVEMMILDSKSHEPVFESSRDGFSSNAMAEVDDILFEAEQILSIMGVKIAYMHSEYTPGQYEVTLAPQIGVKTADDVCLLRDTIRQVAKKHGKKVVFMAMPFRKYGVATGMHYTHSLHDVSSPGGRPFYSASEGRRMSETAKHWLGGLVKHNKAIAALSCPTVNCYRRMSKVFAPVYADWNVDDRTVTYRIKNNSPDGSCIESRLPTSIGNPYVIMAAHVAAGIDGIVNTIACPPAKDENQGNPDKLPRTLTEALGALEEDQAMTKAMSDVFVRWFLALKKWETDQLGQTEPETDEMYQQDRNMYMEL